MSFNRNLPPVRTHQFAMVPRQDVPRSTFGTMHSLKTAFQSGYLVPIHVDEVLPGDVHQGEVEIFARLATPLFPIMDSVHLETFFFFVPARLVWSNWVKMMGERKNPADSINFTVPQVVSPAGGFAVNSIFDYFGLPTVGQVAGGATKSVNVLPLRAYNMIWDEWFRDQNLQNSVGTYPGGDGPDAAGSYTLLRRNKKHDYFTSCLPWPQKTGTGTEAGITMSPTQAPVRGLSFGTAVAITGGSPTGNEQGSTWQSLATPSGWDGYIATNAANLWIRSSDASSPTSPAMYADLSGIVGFTLSQLRLAVATQHLLEADARGGTRYVELLRNHFGVTPEDSRLQRPEYIGGGKSTLQTSAIPQTSATGLTGGTSPLGALGATAIASGRHEFSCHATEHGYIIGLVNVTADLTYQQGLHRMWTRTTRYDFYWPAFAHLGEQAVRNDEIYVRGDANDVLTFGYQERWAEYRHRPSRITGLFRSTSASNIDEWHIAEQFTALPVLNSSFIEDDLPFSRVLAAGVAADNQQILFDSVFKIRSTRPLPVRSVPGLDRF